MKRESNVETYLRQATRGLWGQKRREVREELAVHLSERTTAHRIAGLSEREAEERALRELGAPQHVSVGMAQLYTLPAVMGSSLALLALCLVVVALWPKGFAQPAVEGSFYFPTEACHKALQANEFLGVCERSSSLWLEPDMFKAELRRQGVEIDEGTSLSMTFPNGTYVSLSTASHEIWELGEPERVVRSRKGAIRFEDFYGELLGQPGYVWLEGWNSPTIHVGKVAFRIGTEENRVWGREFYSNVLEALFFQELYTGFRPDSTNYTLGSGDVHNSVTPTEITLAQPGVYGVITIFDRDTPKPSWIDAFKPSDTLVMFEVLKADRPGSFTVGFPKDGRFVTSFDKANNASVSMLVRVSGEGLRGTKSYEIIWPEHDTPEPSP